MVWEFLCKYDFDFDAYKSIITFYRSFQSVLSIVLNKNIGGFNENVVIDSFHGFISSTSWLGFAMSVLSGIFGQVAGFFADRQEYLYLVFSYLFLFIYL